jgi:hypothetical protein
MASNLCFSFRGLHQKLFRATPRGSASNVDDLALQCRMQQVGAIVLGVPALLLYCLGGSGGGGDGGGAVGIVARDSRGLLVEVASSSSWSPTTEYTLLSLANGVAFASYNLASTYVLTRVSVVHHAALNCVRRVFAVFVASILFGSAITSMQVGGMTIAVIGFFSYVHFKSGKKGSARDGRRRELRRKWGGVLLATKKKVTATATAAGGKRSVNGGGWWGGYGGRATSSSSSSSFLPTNHPVK